ncbi:hypothetical protein BDQ17DRAFT_1389747 [Cyathus striatus]|nr:hypothetical protein BDQ17DRAFT_1389747 [Cyathus striatus]
MAGMLETPSRILRRIEDLEGREMPSLPSMSLDDVSEEIDDMSSDVLQPSDSEGPLSRLGSPVHSTPAASTHHTMASTIHPTSSTSSTARFAASLASRSTKSAGLSSSRGSTTKKNQYDSFDISMIPPSLPDIHHSYRTGDPSHGMDEDDSAASVPDEHLPPPGEEQDIEVEGEGFSLSDALQPISRTGSPQQPPLDAFENNGTPKKTYDYSVSLKSEPKVSPFDKYRNIAFRRTINRMRTPSLSRTSSSPATSPANSTPQSSPTASPSAIPLPRSTTASPAVLLQRIQRNHASPEYEPEPGNITQETDARSMDITDVHYSPPRLDDQVTDEGTESDRDNLGEGYGGILDGPSEEEPEQNQTFSTDDGPTPFATRRASPFHPSEKGSPNASSIAENSTALTPTPAFPQPRARFNIPSIPQDLPATPAPQEDYEGEETAPGDDLITPHSRRRSFLLSVINSTARPRFKVPTPHPRHVLSTPSVNELTPVPAPASAAKSNIYTAFAGVTPRPRLPASRRLSHPLSQAIVPSPGTSDSESPEVQQPWAGSAQLSPYDGAVDKASFISTGSSHDLTTHHRMNTSFDPAMGFGAGGQGVGRFDAIKLNNYLHGLNRKLEEENQVLVDRLRKYETVEDAEYSIEEVQISDRRLSGVSRRLSGGTALGNVQENIAEEWLEEKAELEEMLESFKEELARCTDEKEVIEQELESEKAERNRDKERFKDRLSEMEGSAEGKLRQAEVETTKRMKEIERELIAIEEEKDAALERANKAEEVLESKRDLGGDLKAARNRIKRDNVHNLQNEVGRLEGELEAARACIEELEQNAEVDVEQYDHLKQALEEKESETTRLTTSLEEAQQRLQGLEEHLQNANELRMEFEEALDAAEEKMAEDANTIADLHTKISFVERERDRVLERSVSKSLSQNPLQDAPTAEELEALEQELDEARRENARLQVLLNQSPARKAMDKAKDLKIDMLEKEKEELIERNKALRMTVTDINTPNKLSNTSGISPFHRHVLAMSIRAPRTPGGPLRELSWLQNTTADPSTSPLVAEIHRLQRELDRANESIDDKLDKLEDAGLGVVGLTQKLDEARSKIVSLEEEIARLTRKEERRLRYLERARCQKCNIKVGTHLLQSENSSFQISNDTLPTEPPTPPTKTSESLRAEVASVNNRLKLLQKEWEDEKRQLLGERARLQDKTNQLNTETTESERVNERAKSTVQNELERAKSTIAELEADLKAERSRLRVLTVDQNILMQVQRNEADMEDVRQQLTRLKHSNKNLEKELRENANAEQKARLLETRVTENIDTIEQLRQERSFLVSEHKQLQQKYLQVSESANKLRDELATHSTSHDNHRHQLDLRLLELEDLRRALGDRADELERVEAEKNRISAEKKDVSKMIVGLEADLQRVRKDAEAFGRDLKLLRAEKEKLEIKHQEEMAKADRSKKQSQAQIRVLNEQLESQKQKTAKVKEEVESHVCVADERQLSTIKVQHNKECKGLIVQIRYLKAKFVRESAFRSDLGYQKQYLLVLLSQFEKSERNIIASIARIGYPVLPTATIKKPPVKLKSVVQLVVFLRRIR